MSTATLDEPMTERLTDFDMPPWVTSETLFEILDDKVVEKTAMGAPAAFINALICSLIMEHSRRRHGVAIPEILVEFPGTKRRRRPDGVYVSHQRWPKGRTPPEGVSWVVLPEICIEVISPTVYLLEVREKIGEYFAAGVSQVWMVLPSLRQVEVFTSPAESRIFTHPAVVDCDDVIPGFKLDLAEVF